MSYPVALMPLPNDEIGPLLRDLGAAANETGRVFVFCLRLPHGATQWLILTVPVVASDAGEGKEAGYSLPRTEEPFLAKHPAARPSPTDEEFAALKKHLESALSYLSTIIALQHNPLTRALDLSIYKHTSDNPLLSDGAALRRAIRSAIEGLKRGSEEDVVAGRYFEARFVNRRSERKACEWAGVSPRTALRKRPAWIERLMSQMLHQEHLGGGARLA